MKIVHAITCLLRAGAEENTIATCNAQAKRGHEVWLVYGNEVDTSTLETVSGKVHTLQIPSLLRQIDIRSDLAALKQLTMLFREQRPDVVHTHNSKAGFLVRLAARRASVPIVIHSVHILPFINVGPAKKWFYLGLEKYVATFTDAFIAVSKAMRDANLAAGLGTEDNNHVVYSGMTLERFRTAEPADPLGPGPMIAIVASLESRKRHSDFFDVFAALAARHPDLYLCLLGQGKLEPDLRAKAKALGLADRIHFLGFRDDIERWVAAADICVLPSMREGLPRVVVQYAAVGRPIIVTRLPGLEEIVTDGENGFVVASGKVADMEGPLEKLLSDPDLRARMAKASKSRDLSRWSLDRMEPEIERIVTTIASRKAL